MRLHRLAACFGLVLVGCVDDFPALAGADAERFDALTDMRRADAQFEPPPEPDNPPPEPDGPQPDNPPPEPDNPPPEPDNPPPEPDNPPPEPDNPPPEPDNPPPEPENPPPEPESPPPPPPPEPEPAPNPTLYRQVASGVDFSCAIRQEDSRVVCWGDNAHGKLNAPQGPLAHIGLGYDQGCGYVVDEEPLTRAGFVRCWGLNDRLQAEPETAVPVAVNRLVGGSGVTCGLTDVGFGCQSWENFALTAMGRVEFEPVGSIAVGESHACATRRDRVYCWGEAREGRHAAPRNLQFNPSSLVASRTRICGTILGLNTVSCWGPGPAAPNGFFLRLFGGPGGHLCGIEQLPDGPTRAVCWGENADGQTTVPPGIDFQQLAPGRHHTCGLDARGVVHCWGRNDRGQLEVP